MDVSRAHLFITITADDACYERVQRVCRAQGNLSALLASDPASLLRLPRIDRHWQGDESSVTGVIVDLTYPMPSASHASRIEGTRGLASDLAPVLAGLAHMEYRALIVVSADASIDDALRQFKVPVAACIAPDVEDAQWSVAFAALAHFSDRTPPLRSARTTQSRRPSLPAPSATALPLGPKLWFEPSRAILLRQGREIALTARECVLLAILLRTPRTFHATGDLAEQLSQDGAIEVEHHSVQQTVSDLRRKLGDPAKRPKLLQTRRGLGFGIFPRILDEAEVNSPAVARAKGRS